ncbi:hypothetical protein [Paracoccus mutanolyticus]|uniref:hypothetical protein n=1 Tax=Paracoccus mutanolyticus TaxID=1499308 RepID=UPI001679A0FD|nr:hypothetical protein [Paracoccus mutanolyticus]
MDRCTFDLGQLQYQYPEERDDPALTAQDTLARLTWAGAPFDFEHPSHRRERR